MRNLRSRIGTLIAGHWLYQLSYICAPPPLYIESLLYVKTYIGDIKYTVAPGVFFYAYLRDFTLLFNVNLLEPRIDEIGSRCSASLLGIKRFVE